MQPDICGSSEKQGDKLNRLCPPPLLGALCFKFVHLLGEGFSLLLANAVTDGAENLEVLFLQLFKPSVQFLVPWIQDKNLETESRAGDQKVGHRYGSCDNHCVEKHWYVSWADASG